MRNNLAFSASSEFDPSNQYNETNGTNKNENNTDSVRTARDDQSNKSDMDHSGLLRLDVPQFRC